MSDVKSRRIALILVPVLALIGAVASLSPSAAADDEPDTLFVSPLEVGRGLRAKLRLTNVSPAAGDIYDLTYTILDVKSGRLVAAFQNVPIRAGHTLEIDVGKVIDEQRAALELDLPPFRGAVTIIVLGSGGFTNVFGRTSVIANALQQRGAVTYPSHLRWEEN